MLLPLCRADIDNVTSELSKEADDINNSTKQCAGVLTHCNERIDSASSMAFNKKYAGLPDLDLAPDIYETPELTDSSTVLTATVRSSSPFQDESANPDIDRQRLQPDQARSQFLPARVDAREVDFSDSISSRRKAYRTINRTKKKQQDGTEVLGDVSDDEDETLERKLARLRREAEELKEELNNRRNAEAAEDGADKKEGDADGGLLELTRALDQLHTASRRGQKFASAEDVLSQQLSTGLPTGTHGKGLQSEAPAQLPQQTKVPAGLLSNAASFDARLTLLEAALGIPNTPVHISPDDQSESGPQPVLPAINHLTAQLATLSSTLTGPSAALPPATPAASTTTPHIEALTTRIRKLTADADALSAARRRATEAAKVAMAARIAAATSDDPADSLSATSATETDTAASEQAAKVQALYTTLPTIQSLHPLLPSVLERLRSLRAIHAGAANASEDLEALEKRQADMRKEIDQWKEGLKTVEEKVKEAEASMKGNMEVMGPWFKELEGRLGKLGG